MPIPQANAETQDEFAIDLKDLEDEARDYRREAHQKADIHLAKTWSYVALNIWKARKALLKEMNKGGAKK